MLKTSYKTLRFHTWAKWNQWIEGQRRSKATLFFLSLGLTQMNQNFQGEGKGSWLAAVKPKNMFYFEVVLWILPNPTSAE